MSLRHRNCDVSSDVRGPTQLRSYRLSLRCIRPLRLSSFRRAFDRLGTINSKLQHRNDIEGKFSLRMRTAEEHPTAP